MSRNTIITELTALQADGLACVVCDADYLRVRARRRSLTGSQVFACLGCPSDDQQSERGGVLR